LKRIVPILICLAALSGRAERFLTVEEAFKVCFPKATGFEAINLQLRPEEVKAIERETKQNIKKHDLKVWMAKPDGVLMVDQVIGKHEFIDYAVAISTNGRVLQVEILEYREHYGGQVRQPKWREQFQGKTARDPLKLGGDVHNITGATLSCRHVTEGVKKLLATFELVVRPRLLAGSGLRPPA
jgi:Predicted NADH:ubiquinone oxidoreductase, subunit RnfG